MSFRSPQPRLRPPVVQKPSPHGRAAATTRAGASWLAALCLLVCAGSTQAKDTFFSDVPVYRPPTNLVLSSTPTNTSSQANTAPQPVAGPATNTAAGALSPGLTNATSRLSTNSMDALDDKYRLAVGDRISFRIEEDEEDPKPLTVTDSGDLEVPYLGRYAAVGKTCRALAQALKVELERDYYYRATVIIAVDSMTRSRGKVYLVGAVRMAGPQDIPSDEVFSVSKAVLRAGGFTDYADKRGVKITRKATAPGEADQTFTVNVADILEKGKINSDVTLQAGDLVFIPERLVHF